MQTVLHLIGQLPMAFRMGLVSSGSSSWGWCAGNQCQLIEIEYGSYRRRTKRNVQDSDGTLILNMGDLDGGTLVTFKFAQ